MSFTFVRSLGGIPAARTLGVALTSAFVSQATTEKDRLMEHEEKKRKRTKKKRTKKFAQDEDYEFCEDSDNDTSIETDEDDDHDSDGSDSDTSDEGDKVKVQGAPSSASASSSQGQPRNPGASIECRTHYKPPVSTIGQRHPSYTHPALSCESNSHKLEVHEEHRCCCQKPTAPTQPPVQIVLEGDAGLKFLVCMITTITILYTLDRYCR